MKDENQAATSEVANELNSKCQAATNEQQTHGVVGSLDTRCNHEGWSRWSRWSHCKNYKVV
jgi:hypothetical protein